MSAYTKVGIWENDASVFYPVEVQVGVSKCDVLSIGQARTLIRQLERTIAAVERRRAKAGK